ncbi:MAG: hypothetical protein CMP48_05730 [Rickettsiales bacterium]|nr:hypothetical protein [Rickettsiales bacterium]
MSKTSLEYDKKHCKVYHHADINAVHLEWHGFATPELFKEACEKALDLIVKNKSSKVIADNRKSSVVSQENQEYLMNEWFPAAYDKGYRSSAIVVAENVLNQMSVKNIVQKMDQGKFEVQHCQSVDEAKSWLATK